MTEIVQLATAAIAFLAPHLPALAAKASEGAAGEAGKSLFTWLKTRFAGKPAEAALDGAVADPQNTYRLNDLRNAIEEHAETDPDFRTQLTELLKAAGVTITANQTATTVGDNNNTVQNAGSNNNIRIG